MRKRAETIDEFLSDKDYYLVTTKGNAMRHDPDCDSLFTVSKSPFVQEPSASTEDRIRVQEALGVEILHAVRIFRGKHYELPIGHCFAFDNSPEDACNGPRDILLVVPLTGTIRKNAMELFDYIASKHSPILYHKGADVLKMLIRWDRVKPGIQIDLRDMPDIPKAV